MVHAKTAIIRRLSPKMSIVHLWIVFFDLPMPYEVFDLLNKEILGLILVALESNLITDSTLNHLSVWCSGLQKLSLSHCELITDDGIRHFCGSPCAVDHIEELELHNCPLITDNALDYLINCQHLKRVELFDCQLITKAGTRKLRAHLPDLKVHEYFAPVTPPPSVGGGRQRMCRCCVVL
ncbi:F-box/LRR-repeat protein 20-like [Porites lutea]|uniref:F-box/LRR-repeat protein 20-like n=1 Tax=Porites lutea TaxID=51062 RepID=UPI003CC6BA75